VRIIFSIILQISNTNIKEIISNSKNSVKRGIRGVLIILLPFLKFDSIFFSLLSRLSFLFVENPIGVRRWG